jgi:hypothetical protein
MGELWPALPLSEWKDTYATLHMWSQIVGKIKLKHSPRVNHWWNAALQLSPRGLYSGPMLQNGRSFCMEFNFIEHSLDISLADGAHARIALEPKSVAQFYSELLDTLHRHDLHVGIWPVPVEVSEPVPFRQDKVHASYDREYAWRHHQVLLRSARVLEEFRARFIGKCSPVHFFWGSFDLCVTRFSGRRAPLREDADSITREAYSHEVISVGFWPGTDSFDAAYYAYAAPEPAGYREAKIMPAGVSYDPGYGIFLLPYETVRRADDPAELLMQFCQSTYDVAAEMSGWQRAELER